MSMARAKDMRFSGGKLWNVARETANETCI
jgi:hypothetical protein